MDILNQVIKVLQAQNWFVLIFVTIGVLNVLIAFFRAIGLTVVADACLKLENGLQAAVEAFKTYFIGGVKTIKAKFVKPVVK